MRKSPKFFILIILFCISLILNGYLGINSFLKSTYTPDIEDQEILAEMTKMVLDSEQYKEIASKDTIYAIDQGVERFNVADPSSLYHYSVSVKTDKESYIFSCIDEKCTDVSNEGWSYSRYSEEKPILPLSKFK